MGSNPVIYWMDVCNATSYDKFGEKGNKCMKRENITSLEIKSRKRQEAWSSG
jgi:hypothetical protein